MGAKSKPCSMIWVRHCSSSIGSNGLTNRRAKSTKHHRLSYCPECLKSSSRLSPPRGECSPQSPPALPGTNGQRGVLWFFDPFLQSAGQTQCPRRVRAAIWRRQTRTRGHGRHTIPQEQADRVERGPAPERCPQCGRRLETKGPQSRTVIDVQPLRRQTVGYPLEQKYRSHCRKLVRARRRACCPEPCLVTGCWPTSRCSITSMA